MSNETSFLRAIADDPEDDGPRLVFADWLTECGDPRGELIRLQVELARPGPERPEQEQRAALLRAAQPVPRLGHGLTVSVERGLLHVRGTSEGLRAAADECGLVGASWEWVVHLSLEATYSPDDPTRLADLPLPPHAGDLFARLDGDGARPLARAPSLARLRRLGVDNPWGLQTLTFLGLKDLLDSPHLSRLPMLCVRSVNLGAGGGRMLAGSPLVAGLTALDLSHCQLQDDGAAALAGARPLALTRLNLARTGLWLHGLRALAASSAFPHLRELDLGGNGFPADGVRALAASPLPSGLSELVLTHVGLRADGAQELAGARFGALRALQIGHNPLNAGGVQALARASWLAGLETLQMAQSMAGNAAVRDLAAVPFERLATLDLSDNDMGEVGFRALAAAPWLGRLAVLNLGRNRPGEAGMRALVRSDRLGAVETLRLTDALLDNRAVEHLAVAAGLARLTVLDLSNNVILDRGAEALARSAAFPRLRRLYLSDNPVGVAGARALLERPGLQVFLERTQVPRKQLLALREKHGDRIQARPFLT